MALSTLEFCSDGFRVEFFDNPAAVVLAADYKSLKVLYEYIPAGLLLARECVTKEVAIMDFCRVFRPMTSLAVSALLAGAALAGPIPYANPGTENPITYSFTASTTGPVTAYFFSGASAAYTNELTMLVNGVATGTQGLNNHSSPYGTSLVLASVNAGDQLVFEMLNLSPGNIGPWYSDQTLNSDGVNHVYSTDFAGDALIPAGVYLAFEDLPNGGNLNYNDLAFVFTNVAISGVPEPGVLMLLAVAALMSAAVCRRSRS